MGAFSGSDEVGLGFGCGQIIAKRSSGLYWGSSPISQGSQVGGSGAGFGRGGMGGSRGLRGGVGWGWGPGRERGQGPQLQAGHPATGISPQSEDREEIQEAVRACSRLFGALLARGELFVGQLPSEEMVMAGQCPGGPGL